MQRMISILARHGWISPIFMIAALAYLLVDAAGALVRPNASSSGHDVAGPEVRLSDAARRHDALRSLGAMAARGLGVGRDAVSPPPSVQGDTARNCARGSARGTRGAQHQGGSVPAVGCGAARLDTGSHPLADDAVLVAIHRSEILVRRAEQLECSAVDDLCRDSE